ncbi:MAG: hypothetical protein LBE83_00415, partial [Propionibacteriaceae bacterium]|nr:hypothetical protein [Propionibacteriaceae bacterium]
MTRPTDWKPVGRSSDPTPGDPVVVRTGATEYKSVATKLKSAAAALRLLNGGRSAGVESVQALLTTV